MGALKHRLTDRISVLILCLGIWRGLPAQIPAASVPDAQLASILNPSSAIRVSTNLVTVPVSVTDSTGASISNMAMEDFRIEEDGRQERITEFIEAGQSPLQLSLIFDLSGSIYSNFEFEQMAASRFLEKVWKPGDSVSIISVSRRSEILLEASTSLQEALRILSDLQPTEDATAFFDSVAHASSLIIRSTAPSTRQAAVIFSDGEDNRSDRSFMDALTAMRQSNSVVYAINPSGPSIRLNEISRKGQEWLVALTAKTGGAAFVSNRVSDLDGIYDRIAFELRAQYLLSYNSSNTRTDGSFRNISVSIPLKPELHVRARQGYYAIGISPDSWK